MLNTPRPVASHPLPKSRAGVNHLKWARSQRLTAAASAQKQGIHTGGKGGKGKGEGKMFCLANGANSDIPGMGTTSGHSQRLAPYK